MANGNEEDNVWGDDDDDDFFLQTTQVLENLQLQQLKGDTGSRSSSGPTMTPNLAAQAFNSRREILQQNTSGGSVQRPILKTSTEDVEAEIKILKQQCAGIKNRNMELANQLYAAQGESNNLRRQVEKLKQSQQADLFSRLTREREEKQKHEDEKRELKAQLLQLTTDLRRRDNEILKLKTKPAVTNILNRSIGGAQSQHAGKSSTSPTAIAALHQTQPAKFRSDPNLRNLRPGSTSPIVSPQQSTKPKVSQELGIQVNTLADQQKAKDEQLFSGTTADPALDICRLDDVGSTSMTRIRQQIFNRIRRLIEVDYQQHAKGRIESIVARGPKEIMARFTRGVEIKTCFPDFIENMFIYGTQNEKMKKGEYEGKKYPKLGSTQPQILFLDKVYPVVESHFVHDSAWLALKEIKNQLKILLSELNGDNRFRLYELNNLVALWELLVWTRYLWRFVLMEEKFEHNINRRGRNVWIEELKSWTGLLLKIDWRDFFVLELEQLVRGFSLTILEIIVTAGYFDSSQRRYEILYCILKDTMQKDHLRNDLYLRRCLNIITWSNADNRNILNYLCINNNDGNCLARIVGDSVLKCFNETKSSYKATSLLLSYFHLLESLMMKQHSPQFFSNIARSQIQPSHSDESESDEDEEKEDESDVELMDMAEDSFMSTQFACPEKYKFEDGSSERAKRFNNVSASSCWISPVEWELPMEKTSKSEDSPCQCRKILLGSTFEMLSQAVKWWKASLVTREKRIEARENLDVLVLQRLKDYTFNGGQEEQVKTAMLHLSKKLESLQKHFITVCNAVTESAVEEDADFVLEESWTALLQSWNPPEELHPAKYESEKRFPETIFDFAMRNGILLLNFTNFHSENIALAAGSEAFNNLTLSISEAKTCESQPCITGVEKRFLLEIIKSYADENEMSNVLNDSFEYADDEEDEANCSLLLEEMGLEEDNGVLEYEEYPGLHKKKFNEAEFDRASPSFVREIK